MSLRYVIIGNSAAGIGCAEGIRKLDKSGEITIVSSENHHTYSRPLISYLLCGKTDEQRMKYRPDSFYEDNGIRLLKGVTAESVDPKKKTVSLSDGEALGYDRLMIAAGSYPFVPPTEGFESVEKKFTFMTLDSALELQASLAPESRVLVIGAGLIGLKCVEGIYGRVSSITVVDMADRILPSVLDKNGSEIMQEYMEEKGIEFILGDLVTKYEGSHAVLKSGRELDFDILVTAVGVRPNVSLAEGAGCEVNRGIIVDERCETTVKDIYAAGDCTVSHDITTGTDKILALLPNAYMQGETAGINMAGGEAAYDKAIAMNAMGLFGLHYVTAGSYDGEEIILPTESSRSYRKLVVKDGKLKGYIIIGDVERAGINTSLIREQTPLDTIDFELIKVKPQLMAFEKKERSEKLGGVR